MDIKEIKKKKAELETDILNMLKNFEKESGMFIGYINAKIDRGNSLPICGANEKKAGKKGKGLYDINIELNMNRDEY